MAGKRVHFVMPEDLVARIDAACPEGVSRGEFVRRAVEQALVPGGDASRQRAHSKSEADVAITPAPAERLQELAREIERNNARARQHSPEQSEDGLARVDSILSGLDQLPFERSRSSSQAKRDVRPIPKKGER